MKKVPTILSAVSLGLFTAVFVLRILGKIELGEAINLLALAGICLAINALANEKGK